MRKAKYNTIVRESQNPPHGKHRVSKKQKRHMTTNDYIKVRTVLGGVRVMGAVGHCKRASEPQAYTHHSFDV